MHETYLAGPKVHICRCQRIWWARCWLVSCQLSGEDKTQQVLHPLGETETLEVELQHHDPDHWGSYFCCRCCCCPYTSYVPSSNNLEQTMYSFLSSKALSSGPNYRSVSASLCGGNCAHTYIIYMRFVTRNIIWYRSFHHKVSWGESWLLGFYQVKSSALTQAFGPRKSSKLVPSSHQIRLLHNYS